MINYSTQTSVNTISISKCGAKEPSAFDHCEVNVSSDKAPIGLTDKPEIFSADLTNYPIKRTKKKKRKKKRNPKPVYTYATHSGEYNSWKNAKTRCRNPKPKDQKYAGITFSKRFDKFPQFMAHVGPKPDTSYTLDRKDNNRGYVPGNVRWASKSDQAANRKPTIFIEYAGQRLPLKTWAEIHGIPYSTLYGRYHRGDHHPETLFRKVIKSVESHHHPDSKSPASTASTCLQTKLPSIPPWAEDKAIAAHNRARGEPEGLIPLKDPVRNRMRFFRITKEIERKVEQQCIESIEIDAIKKAKRLKFETKLHEKEMRDSDRKAHALRVDWSDEAIAWRKENNVSDEEAIQFQAEQDREEEEEEREDYAFNTNKQLQHIEGYLERRFSADFDLMSIILVASQNIPELEKVLPEKFLDGLRYIEKTNWRLRRSRSSSDSEETSWWSKLDQEIDSHYHGFSCRQEYEDDRDAAIGMGEWPEEDEY